MDKCNLCPRKCGADRKNGQNGYCGADNTLKVARAALHLWEEPPISGERGSGTVFFSNCPLKCVYCQNREISYGGDGIVISESRLTDIYFELRALGAHNINLVSPTQYASQIADSIVKARKKGFDLPFVYNTGGYETVETLKMLDGLIDIYLTDFKYMSDKLSEMYSSATDYPHIAKAALREMFRQHPTCVYDGEIMKSGVIVRHLVLPDGTDDSKNVIGYLHDTYGDDIVLSIMSQYTPSDDCPVKRLRRKLTADEYSAVVEYSEDIGVTNAFIQDGESVSESFIPKFDYTGVLPKGE